MMKNPPLGSTGYVADAGGGRTVRPGADHSLQWADHCHCGQHLYVRRAGNQCVCRTARR